MSTPQRTLHYVADPMCSWCWGFHSELQALRAALPADVTLEYVMGGLAPDSELPMPAEVRSYVQAAWREVQKHTGAPFNWDFWERCEPRRSTYPACRAVIAARQGGVDLERKMFEAIQRAYYQEARNPSLDSTLIELAAEIGLPASFERDLGSREVEQAFASQRELRQRLRVDSFPSLVLQEADGSLALLMRGSGQASQILAAL